MKKYGWFLLFSLLVGAMLSPTISHATPPDESLIYLKVNPYYILYTRPHGPLMDSKNRLLIPLRTIQDLFGGEVTYDAKTKTATVKWLDHTFELKTGSTSATVDGKKVEMDTTPLFKEGALLLPIRLFLDYTDIKYTWNQKKHLLHITDERIEKGELFEFFKGQDLPESAIVNENALDLLSYKIIPSTKIQGYSNVVIKAKNNTDKDIQTKKGDIFQVADAGKGPEGGYITDSYSRPIAPPLPIIKKGKTIEVVRGCGTVEKLQYIIAVGRETK